MVPRVLLTNCPTPYPVHPPTRDGIDQFGLRMTKHQGLFSVPIDYPFQPALHLMARNLRSAQVTVLDTPDWGLLARELASRPDVVGLTFPVALVPRAVQTARLVRSLAPGATLVLGGHGVLVIPSAEMTPVERRALVRGIVPHSPAQTSAEELSRLAHRVCRDDGIAFLRALVGEEVQAEIDGVLPPSGVLRPFGLPLLPMRNMLSLVPALGCSGGCDFCTTGAFFRKRRVVLTPEAAHRAISAQLARVKPGDLAYGVVMDEDLLFDRHWMHDFGERLAADPEVERTGFTYTTFGSARSLSLYTIDELLRWRVNNVWIGVETTIGATGVGYLDRKKYGDDRELFRRLHQAGISTNGSFILGWDFHDRHTIEQDLEMFLSLEPTSVQVLPLIPAPGTRLFSNMVEAGRIRPLERWEDMHYYSTYFRYKNFTTAELWDLEDRIENRLFSEQGPYFLKLAQVDVNGFDRANRPSAQAHLLSVYRRRLIDMRPALPSIARFAPSPGVAQKARELISHIDQRVGPPKASGRIRSVALLAWNALRSVGIGPDRPYQPTSHTTTYRRGRIVMSDWGGEQWESAT